MAGSGWKFHQYQGGGVMGLSCATFANFRYSQLPFLIPQYATLRYDMQYFYLLRYMSSS